MVSGLVSRSALVMTWPFGSRSLMTESLAALTALIATFTWRVLSSVSSKGCCSPHSDPSIAPWKPSLVSDCSTWFCRWSTSPETASTIEV